MKKNKFLLFFLLIISGKIHAQYLLPEKAFSLREDYLYEVFYGPILLGHVTIETPRDTIYDGIKSLSYKIIMKSNPNLWFLPDKEEHYYSYFAPYKDKSYGLLFWTDDLDSDVMKELVITPMYDLDMTVTEFRTKKKEYFRVDLPLIDYSLLGPDIYLFSRFFAGRDTVVKSPIYVDSAIQEITLNYTSTPEKRFYAAFDDSVETTQMIGDAPFEGPFGFKGRFYAWYTNDSLRVPTEAHAEVWIGFVKVRLIRYRRYPDVPFGISQESSQLITK